MVKFLRRQLASPQRSDIAPASNNGSSARVRKDLPKSAREVAGSPPVAEELGDVGEAPYAHRIDDDARTIAGVAPVACGTNMKKSGRVHVAVLLSKTECHRNAVGCK